MAPETRPGSRPRIAALDGLRAIAVVLVLMGHGAEAYLAHPDALWLAPFVNSSLGVRLFFVLSGYLITSLLLHEQQRWGRIDLRAFYARRILRIWPAVFAYLGVIALLAAAGWIEVSQGQFLAAATFSWNYAALWLRDAPSQGSWFLGHLWTLALEQQFYLFWPLLIVLAGWRRARWVALVVPLLMPLVRIGLYFLVPDQRGYLGMMFHTAIDSILVGCAVALFQQPIERWLQPRPWTLPVAMGFVLVVSPLLGTLVRPYRITVGFGLDALCCGVLILAAERSGLWSRWLGSRMPVFLGTISYGLYVWQQLFLTPLNTTFSGLFPLSVLAALACALVSFHAIEQPFLRLKVLFQRASL
jgi:peptidoglycan/LPS O-acetylase OafA/YrhL